MTKNELRAKVLLSAQTGREVKVYFNDTERTPIIGHFVKLKDHDELVQKGFIRFSSRTFYDKFTETRHVMYTRLHGIESFSYLKFVNEETKANTAVTV